MPDATPNGGSFPASTLGLVYYGYPEERWVDLSAFCAAVEKPSYGFAAVLFDADLDGRTFDACRG